MKATKTSLYLAVLGGLGLMAPSLGHAANVGYLPTCVWAGGQGDPSSIISAAGHTPVAVTTANTASLSGLAVLMVSNCNGQSLSTKLNADVSTAVSNGMK